MAFMSTIIYLVALTLILMRRDNKMKSKLQRYPLPPSLPMVL